jgi:mannosyltransferase
VLLPPVITLIVVSWQIQRPSYWRDEGATLSAVTRPGRALLAMLGHADAVHGAYYLGLWVITRLGGTSEAVTRLPSAVAMAIAAAAIAGTGRRLVSTRAGLLSGLVFAVLPEISRYGQEARSYALVTAIAAVASYLLARVLTAERDRDPHRTRWLAAYGCALAFLGLVNIFGLTLIPAHLVTVILVGRRRPRASEAAAKRPRSERVSAGRRDPGRRSLLTGWVTAALAAVVTASPVLWLAWQQREAQDWLKPPGLSTFEKLHDLIGSGFLAGALLLAVIGGIVIGRRTGRLPATWPAGVPALALPWLLLPPALLITVSLIQPLYTLRYIIFVLPAVALLAGTGLAALEHRWLVLAALALIVAAAVPGQVNARKTAAHGDNIRQADRWIAAVRHPGDTVVYTGRDARYMAAAYPYGLAQLRNIGLARPKIPSRTLAGSYLHPPGLHDRLAGVHRVWVVTVGTRERYLPELRGLGFHLVHRYHPSDLWLSLYTRPASRADRA